MKVCAKCGWQNEDQESKCFQCYADLPAASRAKRAKKSEQPEVVVSPEPENEALPQDDSVNVWNDPDMRPIVHDTIDDLSPLETPVVKLLEETVVEDDEDEPVYQESEPTGFRVPLWAVMAAVLGFVLIIALIGRCLAKSPEGSPQKAVSCFMDAVVAKDIAATRSSLSANSQQIAGMAPYMLGTVGVALSQGADLTYSIDREEKLDNKVTIVWCNVKADKLPYGCDSVSFQDTVPVFAKVEKGKWIADLKMTAIHQASHKMKNKPLMTSPPKANARRFVL